MKVPRFIIKQGFNDTIIISCSNIVWLNVYHWNDMYWLCIIYIIIVIIVWIINNNLLPDNSGDYTTRPTVDWINLWAHGTFITMHCITYKLTTQPYFLFFIEGFGLYTISFTASMRAHWCLSLAPWFAWSEVLPF